MSVTSFTDSDYDTQKFKGVQCQQEELAFKEFDGCTFTDCSFRETMFRNCVFRECRFKGSDLSLISVENCSFIDTTFEDCQLIGVNWTEANWNDKGFLKQIDFTNCVINYSTFFGLKLTDMKLADCLAKEVDFVEADLSGASCVRTDFLNSRFHQTDLTRADFTEAINYSIAPNSNTLKETKFSLPEAMSLLYGLDIILSE